MSEALKVLGQISPPATTLTDLYTVPVAKSAVSSTLVVCNQTSSSITFRVSVAVAGAVDAVAQYLYYDVTLVAKSSLSATIGIALAATDVVRVYASTAGVSFNLFGTEIS